MFFLLVGKAVNIWLFLSSKACGKGAGAFHGQRVGRQLVLSLLMSPVLKFCVQQKYLYIYYTRQGGLWVFFSFLLGVFLFVLGGKG